MSSSIAQTKSYGKLIIENKGEIRLYDAIDFRVNIANNTKGIIGTERNFNRGFISFMPGSTWTNATNDAYVDGYVKSYQSGSFIFPIGDNNVYRPIKISASSKLNPTDAAYFGVNPSVAITSAFFGTTTPILPTGGPFSANQKALNISAVSTKEYWDINGTTPTKISLTWNTNSAISSLTTNILNNLVIVGWDGSKWIEIPSKVDVNSFLGPISTYNSGSITTNSDLIPSTYSVYTLASYFPNKTNVFSVNVNSKLISQNQSFATNFVFNSNINDTSLIVTFTHSTPKFGVLSNITQNGYTYTASNNYIGLDSIISKAKILNKPSGMITYDSFVNEIFVQYQKNDTNIDMSTSTSVTLGKSFLKTQNLGLKYYYKSKYGTMDLFNSGVYRYQSSKYNFIDTTYVYFEVNYLGLKTTTDTTRYIIKLANGVNSISLNSNEKYFIPNLISPNGDGTNDYWILPKELTNKSRKLNVTIYNLDGKMIYENQNYQNDWPSQNQLIEGVYLYQIYPENEEPIKGLLRINNQ